MQVYRGLDIGTAKPSLQERTTVPHHLIDVVSPDQAFSAGRYARAARTVIADIHARGRLPLLVGGTGLYIRAVLHGLIEDVEADPELRDQLESEAEEAVAAGDPGRLHRRLAERDPAAAARIHPNDTRRVVRALEIAAETGREASEVRQDHGFDDAPYRVLHLALEWEREALYERIDRRCEAMIEQGLLQELRSLQEAGYGPDLRPMRAIGYRHLWPVVRGEDTLAAALPVLQRDTRHFARRQLTGCARCPTSCGWTRRIPRRSPLGSRSSWATGLRERRARPAPPGCSRRPAEVGQRGLHIDQRMATLRWIEERGEVPFEEQQSEARRELEEAGGLANRRRHRLDAGVPGPAWQQEPDLDCPRVVGVRPVPADGVRCHQGEKARSTGASTTFWRDRWSVFSEAVEAEGVASAAVRAAAAHARHIRRLGGRDRAAGPVWSAVLRRAAVMAGSSARAGEGWNLARGGAFRVAGGGSSRLRLDRTPRPARVVANAALRACSAPARLVRPDRRRGASPLDRRRRLLALPCAAFGGPMTPPAAALPIVAIVGRPNVGKSTLFNRFAGHRRALVEDRPGITRDRIAEEVEVAGRAILLVDTAGLDPEAEAGLPAAVQAQAQSAIEDADAILWVADAQAGVLPDDEDLGRMLRRTAKPVSLAVNKVDVPAHQGRVGSSTASASSAPARRRPNTGPGPGTPSKSSSPSSPKLLRRRYPTRLRCVSP